ncbi:MAG TPA: tryptophan 2,3-dioxygenase [Allosphingosinicella sp.]|nr:tryptophan 2,3-dioxygenase [Allosphingosinicella sp.]
MTDTPAAMTYGSYLSLDQLLSAQHPLSANHDEMLFVILHQTKELWLKQIMHELDLATGMIRDDHLIEVHKALSRVTRIQAVMTLSWDVLATMTPSDYTSFREVLGASSGFQSAQFREFEYRLGLKDGNHLRFHDEGSAALAALTHALHRPSLWDEAIAAAARAGIDMPPGALEREWSEPYRADPAVAEGWAEVYRAPEKWWALYQLAEKLVDLDDALATWRHKHVVTVERIIGLKRGTGGTAGVAYLQSTLGKRAFPELWSLRTLI